MTIANKFMITGPKIYLPNAVLQNSAVLIEDGIIQDIVSQEKLKDFLAIEKFSFSSEFHLVPGFIDMHVHGASGCDVMDASVESLMSISATLASQGTTAFLATTMTAAREDIENTLFTVSQFLNSSTKLGAAILGVHLEGPFLSLKKTGAQNAKNIIHPDLALFQEWHRRFPNLIKLVTLAPELSQGLELISYLKKENIIASIGHSNASFDEANNAIAAGCSHATHLFNAMPAIHHREPGAVTAVLLSDEMTAELIVDGIHLHPAIVRLALKTKGIDKIILITDAMRASCMQDGCYDLGGQTVYLKNGRAQLADGTLAGSVLSMSTAIKNVIDFTKCTLLDVIKMTSENPAKSLKIFDKKGSIEKKKDADFVLLDNQMDVVATFVRGRKVYQK